ncbi:MAG: tetratricopeptide repeat protein [Spirochaetes bacterium]|nr:tetratricopeptide repeat protein [Spirochaetota bacterium]
MGKMNRVALLFLIALLLLSSCSRGKLVIMEANFFYSRGRYDDAIAAYLRALDFPQAAPYAEFGLGALFYTLGEDEAALERFENSRRLLSGEDAAGHRELLYRLNYNYGIILFGQEDFYAAAAAFREALRIEPQRLNARRNLELALLALERGGGGDGEAATDDETEAEGLQAQQARDALFQFMRDRERDQWRATEWEADAGMQSGPDF